MENQLLAMNCQSTEFLLCLSCWVTLVEFPNKLDIPFCSPYFSTPDFFKRDSRGLLSMDQRRFGLRLLRLGPAPFFRPHPFSSCHAPWGGRRWYDSEFSTILTYRRPEGWDREQFFFHLSYQVSIWPQSQPTSSPSQGLVALFLVPGSRLVLSFHQLWQAGLARSFLLLPKK